ncbi:MAG: hypothetical protein IKO63_05200 [Paludibacteraceae bacterium]|nr:hypothetical protein [Paludibacteraceae bacterium]
MKPASLLQLITASVLSIGGLVLLFCGVYIAPQGEIHESLLVAFGEAATFAGALFGIDYTYKFRSLTNGKTNRQSGDNSQTQVGTRAENDE